MILKNNRGFSIVELLIVVGMLGGVSLVAINIGKLTNKSSVKMQLDSDVTLTTNEINGILSDPVKCKNILGNTINPQSINGKYYISTNTQAPVAGHGNSGLKITSYTLSGTAPDGVLTILFENKNILKGASGGSNISKKINLYIEGTLGAIVNCRSVSTGISNVWERGIGQDINYNAGKVGIGIATPATLLQVAGPIATALTTKNSSYGITDEDSMVLGDATSGSLSFTLPSAVGIVGREYTLKKIDSSVNVVKVITENSQTIDGVPEALLSKQWDVIKVASNGINWIVTSGNGSNVVAQLPVVPCNTIVKNTASATNTTTKTITLNYSMQGGGGGGGGASCHFNAAPYSGTACSNSGGVGGRGGSTNIKVNGIEVAVSDGGIGGINSNGNGTDGAAGVAATGSVIVQAGALITITVGGGGGGGGSGGGNFDGNAGSYSGTTYTGGTGGAGGLPGFPAAGGTSGGGAIGGGGSSNGATGWGAGGGGGGGVAGGGGGGGGSQSLGYFGGSGGTTGGTGIGGNGSPNSSTSGGDGTGSGGGGGIGVAYSNASGGNGGNGPGGGGHGATMFVSSSVSSIGGGGGGGAGGIATITYSAESCFL